MVSVIFRILLISMLLFVGAGCEKLESTMDRDQQDTSNQPGTDVFSDNVQQYPVATFAAGCFWGVEHNFRRVPGVMATAVGFMGGTVDNPSYKEVCYEDTRHAEVVHLRYDPDQVSYEQLVRIFFILHDPTTLNRQGPDVGDQYRSAIFYHTPEQQQVAQQVKKELNASGAFKRPIVTEITTADTFWKAEDYHQQYIAKNPLRPCHLVDFDEVKKILNQD